MRVVWVTDPHLDHASPLTRRAFHTEIRKCKPNLVLLGGDIGESTSWRGFVEELQTRAGCRVLFVLGNHDYYGSNVGLVQGEARDLVDERGGEITWLPETPGGFIGLGPRTALIGEGGWGDWSHGEFGGLVLNDYRLIQNLKCSHPRDKKDVATELGYRAAMRLQRNAELAINKGFEHLVVLTHVPPWPEASWHKNLPGEPEAQPFFVWGQGGRMLDELIEDHPGVRITTLSGHTHSGGVAMLGTRVTAITGGARYRYPAVTRVMEIE